MRAVVVGEIGNRTSIKITETDTPKPKAGQVLIEAHNASINFPDLLQIDGKYQIKPPLPFIPGKEAAGTVISVGDDVKNFSKGDRVSAQVDYGAFAEQILAPEKSVYPLPDAVDFKNASVLGLAYVTAYVALTERAQIKSGDIVLVTGAAGGVGLAAVQLAKTFGATVLAGLTTMSKQDTVRDAGTDYIIDMSHGDLKDSVRQQVKDAISKNVDIVIDPVGGDIFDACLRTLNWCGRIVTLGFTSGRIPEIKANYLLLKNISASGMTINGYLIQEPETVRHAQSKVFALYAQGKFKPVISSEHPLEDFGAALNKLESRDFVGKIVLSIK
ncbi:MAG: NADPH:quinone oxidoreductase family protein [Gammaproteobacteria bacterium]|nr:NADPH:quinone oxidoreductase family protein [Gammaproteobacteria bacterium]